MSKALDNLQNKIEILSERYDDNKPEHIKQLKKYLTRPKKTAIETRRAPFKKKSDTQVPPNIELDINFPKFFKRSPLAFFEVQPKSKEKKSTGLAKILEVDDDL